MAQPRPTHTSRDRRQTTSWRAQLLKFCGEHDVSEGCHSLLRLAAQTAAAAVASAPAGCSSGCTQHGRYKSGCGKDTLTEDGDLRMSSSMWGQTQRLGSSVGYIDHSITGFPKAAWERKYGILRSKPGRDAEVVLYCNMPAPPQPLAPPAPRPERRANR